MAKFNKSTKSQPTVNLAGGQAYKETNKLELVSILLTSFVQDQFYRSAEGANSDLKNLIQSVKDKTFVAKAAIYARNQFGMRSITHIAAGEIAHCVKGENWTRRFYDSVVHRVDDITEILSYYISAYGKPLPNSLKKGLAKAFAKFDEYQLAKYKSANKGIKLVDAVNLLHPSAPKAALKKLMLGTLKPAETWETKLTQAGQKADGDDAKLDKLKAKAWKDLIKERKLGYFALLRNLRNILEQAPEVLSDALDMLTDKKLIEKSLVLPVRYLTAIKEIEKLSSAGARKTLQALNKALDISCANVPKFKGDTLVVLDKSGSMNGEPLEHGALFAAILAKANNADVLMFAQSTQWTSLNPSDSTLTLAQQLIQNTFGGGTDFKPIFPALKKSYARVIILSDMQGWVGYNAPRAERAAYEKKYGKTKVYSFDLAGLGTLQFPEQETYCLAGFSEKVFDIMKLLEKDKQALIHEIEAVEL